MMIGARTAAWAKSGGFDPHGFDTDGLIAYWDAKDGASSDGWTDLVGAFRLSVVGSVTLAENAVVCDNGYFSGAIPEALRTAAKSGEISFDAFVRSMGAGTAKRVFQTVSSISNEFGATSNNSTGSLVTNFAFRYADSNRGFAPSAYAFSGGGAFSASLSDGLVSFVYNGISAAATSGTSPTRTTAIAEGANFAVGGNFEAQGIELCALLFYSKARTPEMIAENHAVGRARFGLTY